MAVERNLASRVNCSLRVISVYSYLRIRLIKSMTDTLDLGWTVLHLVEVEGFVTEYFFRSYSRARCSR